MNVIGIDVSKYDLGWKAANAVKPISFIIQRASYGIITDEQFAALLPEVQKSPILPSIMTILNFINTEISTILKSNNYRPMQYSITLLL